MDSSLGSGKICSSVFVCAIGCLVSFFSAGGSDRTLEFLHCDGISSGSQVVLFLGHSAGAVAPLFFHACACGISLCGFLEVFFCSVFLSSACGFLFTAFSRQLAAIGILFVVSSTGRCLTSSVLCSSSSQLSFFSCECLLGAWWCSPIWGPCKFSFAFCGSFAPF